MKNSVQIFSDVLTDKDRQKLLTIKKNTPNDIRNAWPRSERIPIDEKLSSVLTDILTPIIGEHTPSNDGMFITIYDTFLIHNDGGLHKKSILIPLEIDPVDGEAFTVFFKQHRPSPHYKIYTQKKPTLPCMTNDYNDLISLEETQFDENIHQTYFSHLKKEDLNGLSIEQICKWELGQIITFPTTQIHCGSDLQPFNTKSKTYILYKI